MQPRTPRPSWADLEDDDLLRDERRADAPEQPAPERDEEDAHDDMNTENFYLEVNDDAEMVEHASSMVDSVLPENKVNKPVSKPTGAKTASHASMRQSP